MRRLPHKGDRVRFWELTGGRWVNAADPIGGVRTEQTGTVLRRRGRYLYLEIDGRDGTFSTAIREMEILPKEVSSNG